MVRSKYTAQKNLLDLEHIGLKKRNRVAKVARISPKQKTPAKKNYDCIHHRPIQQPIGTKIAYLDTLKKTVERVIFELDQEDPWFNDISYHINLYSPEWKQIGEGLWYNATTNQTFTYL